MAWLPVELDDLEIDIADAFEEVGDTGAMDIFDYDKPKGGLVYKEQKYKTFKKQISLTGRIRLSPKSEELSDAGRRKECTCIFTFSTRHLKDTGVIKVEPYTHKETCSITLDSIIRYKARYYEVKNILPFAMIGDRFLLYKFECNEVTDLSKLSFDEGSD